MAKNTTTRYRNVGTGKKAGQFVKKSEADKAPERHVREQVPKPGRGDTGRGKNK